MIHLIYDTETTGLPIDYKAHVHEVDNWPRVVQLAWMLVDDDFQTLTSRDHLIKPWGWEIEDHVAELHGITTEKADRDGIHIRDALIEFAIIQEAAHIQVGHNVNFDRKVVGSEFIRAGMEDQYEYAKVMPRYCTMMNTTKLCGLRNARNGLKWPSLQELHFHLFNEEFVGGHNAMVDVEATRKCYEQLIIMGHFNPETFLAEQPKTARGMLYLAKMTDGG
jgi:DNA polymerase III epsilon subunit-like protein